jgi:hypothetical protein
VRKERKDVLAFWADVRVHLPVRQSEINTAEHVVAVLAVNVVMPMWGTRGTDVDNEVVYAAALVVFKMLDLKISA